MKKLLAITLTLILCISLMAAMPYKNTQDQAHQIAELARQMGLPENDPIILRAQEIWREADADFQTDRDIIATVVYSEAWGGCTARHRELVAAVIVNRVNSDKFPDTVYDVVNQSCTANGKTIYQYSPQYVTPGSKAWNKARKDPTAWAECQAIATKAINGEVICPVDVLFQAEVEQGLGVYEVCKTTYSTTYFCYG